MPEEFRSRNFPAYTDDKNRQKRLKIELVTKDFCPFNKFFQVINTFIMLKTHRSYM